MPLTVTVKDHEVAVAEEFVYHGSLIHSSVQSTHDINRRSAIAHAAMQSLDNQICPVSFRILSTLPPEDWRRPRGRPCITWLGTIQQDLIISTSTKLRMYNTWILPIFLYGSDCWAVSRTDARKIDAFDQWCLLMLLSIK